MRPSGEFRTSRTYWDYKLRHPGLFLVTVRAISNESCLRARGVPSGQISCVYGVRIGRCLTTDLDIIRIEHIAQLIACGYLLLETGLAVRWGLSSCMRLQMHTRFRWDGVHPLNAKSSALKYGTRTYINITRPEALRICEQPPQ